MAIEVRHLTKAAFAGWVTFTLGLRRLHLGLGLDPPVAAFFDPVRDG
jgi:hypothetical protein